MTCILILENFLPSAYGPFINTETPVIYFQPVDAKRGVALQVDEHS